MSSSVSSADADGLLGCDIDSPLCERVCTLLECSFDTCRDVGFAVIFFYNGSIVEASEPAMRTVSKNWVTISKLS